MTSELEIYHTIRHGIVNGTATTIRLEHKVKSFAELVEELDRFKKLRPNALPLVGIREGKKTEYTGWAVDLGDEELMLAYEMLSSYYEWKKN